MAYQVLARKWRPRDFSQMVGQGHVLRALVNALDSERLHHAYLFTGTRGVGKTSIARVFAKALNCEKGISSTPCGVCSACVEIDEGRYVDLLEVDAASRTKVDETRELLDNVQYAPARGRFKVYLIDEVHMFSNHSFNALLKTLEEPPSHVKFLLATTDPKRLPITILSRCLQFNLKRLSAEQIKEQLVRILLVEKIEAEPAALSLIATAADGSMRDSLSLLDQAIAFTGGVLNTAEVSAMLGAVSTEQIVPLIEALAAGDGAQLLATARELAEFAPDFAQVLGEILSTLRRVAVYQVLGDKAGDLDESAHIIALASAISPEECQLNYQIGLLARRDLPLAPEPQIGFEMALMRMLAFRPLDTVPPAPVSVRPTPTVSAPTPAPAPSRAEPKLSTRASGVNEAPPVLKTPAQPTPTTPNASTVTPPVSPNEWAALVARLETSGLVRELAKHCVLIRDDGKAIELAITPQFENIKTESRVKGLEAALRLTLQRDVNVRFTTKIPPPEVTTPAQQISAAEAQREADAAREVENDPNVQTLQQRFGAVIEKVTAK